jgi:hypothetical protein
VDILYDAWKRYLEPHIGWLWESLAFWQGAALFLLTVVVLAVIFRGRLAQWVSGSADREHDATIFKKFDEAASEEFMDGVINGRIYNGWLTRSDISTLDGLRDLQRTEYRYHSRRMRRAATRLTLELRKLLSITSTTFFHIGHEEYKFYPDPIEKDHYDREWARLQAQITPTWDAYQDYRLSAKKALRL